jgi:hypothetical protein
MMVLKCLLFPIVCFLFSYWITGGGWLWEWLGSTLDNGLSYIKDLK